MWRLLSVVVALAVAAGCAGDIEVAEQQLSIEHTTVTATPATAIADGVSAARILVSARDADGRAIAGREVSLTLTGEKNALSAETATTNRDGVAEFLLTSTLAEQKRVTASIGEVTLEPITVNFIAGPPAKFEFLSPPSDTVAGAIINPAVQLRLLDKEDNQIVLQSFEVSLALGNNDAGARLRGTTSASSVGGLLTFQDLSVDRAGEYTLVASTSGIDGQASAPFTISPAAPTRLAFLSSPSDPRAGVPLSPPLTVAVQDRFGNVVADEPREVTIGIGSGPAGRSIDGTLTATTEDGLVTFDDVVLRTSGEYTLTASADGLSTATSEPFTVGSALPTRIVFRRQPAATSAGTTLRAMEAVAQDAVGNVVPDFDGEAVIAIASGPAGATLAGTTTLAFDKGVVRFDDLTLDLAGDYALTVTSGTLEPAVSNTFKISPAAPKRLVFTNDPSDTVAGAPIDPALRVSIRDDFGNVVTNVSYLVSLHVDTGPQDATLSGTRTAIAIGGEASFSNAQLTLAGQYTLRATAGTLAPAISAPFTVSPGPASRLAFSVEPSRITAGQPISPAVQVLAQDIHGNTVPGFDGGVTVSIASGPGGAALTGATTTSAVAGVATFPGLSIDKSGDFTLAATAAGLASATSAPFPVDPASPTRLAFAVKPPDSAAGQTLSPAVRVFIQDDLGNTVPTATGTVTLTIASGPTGATLSGTTVVNAVDGVATFPGLSIETSGRYTLGAEATGLAPATSDAFDIRPAAPAKLRFQVEPSQVVAGEAIGPAVRVAIEDRFGNVVESATNRVALTLAGTPGAVLTGGSGENAVDGVATFDRLSLDKTGTYTLIASSGVLAGATSATFEVVPAAPDRLVVVAQPTSGTAGALLAPALAVQVHDRFGNLCTDSSDPIALAVTEGPAGGALVGTATLAASGGVASFDDLSVEKSGRYTLTATSGTLRSATAAPFTVSPAAAAKLAWRTGPTSTLAGRQLAPALEVEVQDAFGNLVPSTNPAVTVAIDQGPTGAVLQGTATATATNGLARFANLALRTAGDYTLTATADALTATTSSPFTIAHAEPHALALSVQPSNAGAGAPIAPAIEVTVEDAWGNVATSSNNLVRASIASGPAGATLAGTTARTPTSGVVRFDDLAIDTSGLFTLAFEANGLTGQISEPFTVSSGGGARLAFEVEPSDTVAGKPMAAVRVKVQDAWGNDVTDATDTITLAIGSGPVGAILEGVRTATAVDGVATFTGLSIEKSGRYTLTASAPGRTAASSEPFRIHADAPVALAIATQPSDVIAGEPISPAVAIRVLDQYGNVAEQSNDQVVITIASGTDGATLFGNTTAGPSSGVVTLGNLRLDKVGSYTLTASSGALPPVTTTSFEVRPAAPASLAWSDQPTDSVAGEALAQPVTVRLLDAFGNDTPAATDSITVSIASGPQGATLSGTRTVTAVGGVATFDDLSLDKAGAYSLRATSDSLAADTSAFFQVSASTASRLAFTVEPASTAAGRHLSPALQVTIQDRFGNPVTSATHPVFLTLGPGSPGAVLHGQTTQNANGGVARFPDLSINLVGAYTLVASAAGLESATSAAFEITPGAPARLEFLTQPADVVAGVPMASGVQVQVRDAFGNVAPAQVEVSLTIANGPPSGTLLGTTAAISSAGVASFPDLSADKVGGYILTASAGTLVAATSGIFYVSPAPASRLAWTVEPTDEIAGEILSPVVSVRLTDAFGNLVADDDRDVTLTLGSQPGGATLSGNTTATSSGGEASFPTLSLDKSGSYTLVASAPGLASAISAPFVISAAAKEKLAFTVQPPNAGAGDPLVPGIQVTVQDRFGNTVLGASDAITLAIASGRTDGQFRGTKTVAAVDGVAVFNDISLTRTDTYRLSASAPGLSSTISEPFEITWGSFRYLAFVTQPTNTTAGETLNPAVVVEIQDLFGNRIRNATHTVGLGIWSGPPGATLEGTVSVAAVNGHATFNDVRITRAGTYRLSAGSGAVNPTASSQFNVSPAAASRVGFVAVPQNAVAGQPFAPAVQVEVQDPFGNTVTGASGAVTLAVATGPAGANFGGTHTRPLSAGIASFDDLTLDLAGPYTLGASAPGLDPAVSTTIDVRHAAKSKLVFAVPPSAIRSGDPFDPPIQVMIQDAYGNRVLDAQDTLTLSLAQAPPGGQLRGPTAVAASAGIATFTNVTVNKKGDYRIQAAGPGVTPVTSSQFTVDNNIAQKLAFSVQPANGTADATLATIQVHLLDRDDNLVSEATDDVTLSVATGPGALQGSTTVAAVGGVATFTNVALRNAGTYTLAASSGSLQSATSTSFEIAPGAPVKVAFASVPNVGTAGTALPPLVARFQDAWGNFTTDTDTIDLTVETGPGPLGGTTSRAATNGVATFDDLVFTVAGDYTLRASSGGLDPAVTVTIVIGAGAPSRLAFGQQPTDAAAGATISPAVTVQVTDDHGNLTAGYSGAVTLSVSGGVADLLGTTTVNASAGVATFSDLQLTATGTYTLVASASGLTDAVSDPFTISAGAPTKYAFVTQPADAVAGSALNAVVVEITDDWGNRVTDASATVEVALGSGGPAGATLAGVTSRALVGGIATFDDLVIEKAGVGYFLVASDGIHTRAESDSFAITPAAPSALAFGVQPSNSVPNVAIAPAVTVQILDAYGNLTDSNEYVTITIESNPTGAVLAGDRIKPAVDGIATFDDLSINLDGTGYTLAASSGSLSKATSAAFDVEAFRIGSFTSDKGEYAVSETATLSWTSSGTPAGGLVLDPLGAPVSGGSASVTPFPDASTSTAWYRLAEAGAPFRAELTWAVQAGGSGDDFVSRISARDDGGFYATGLLAGEMTVGSTTLTQSGDGDAWFARYAADGSVVWAKAIRIALPVVNETDVATLSDGGAAFVGQCAGELLPDDTGAPGASLLCSNTGDAYVARYRADGSFAWARHLGSNRFAKSMAVAPFGDGLVVGGMFKGTLLLDAGGPNETTLNANGGNEAFVAAYASNGALLWAKQFGGSPQQTWVMDLATDGDAVYATGLMTGDALFGQGEPNQTLVTHAGGSDSFVARLDANGQLEWVRSSGGTAPELVKGLAALPGGGVVLAGDAMGTAVFGGETGSPTQLVPSGAMAGFMVGYDATGALLFAKQIDTSGSLQLGGVAAQPDGSFVVTGTFIIGATFGPAEANETVLLDGHHTGELFLASYTSSGLVQWATRAGGPGFDQALCVDTLADGSIIVGGRFPSQATFGAGERNETTLNGTGQQVFFSKHTPVNYRFLQVDRTP